MKSIVIALLSPAFVVGFLFQFFADAFSAGRDQACRVIVRYF